MLLVFQQQSVSSASKNAKIKGANIIHRKKTPKLRATKIKDSTIYACTVCSPDMPESEASYAITAGGIADAKE